jgi:hypothetical protein
MMHPAGRQWFSVRTSIMKLRDDQKSVGVICSTSRSLWRMSELILKPVNVLTPTVKVETKTKPRSAVVKNFAIGFLPSIEDKLWRDRSASCDGNHRAATAPSEPPRMRCGGIDDRRILYRHRRRGRTTTRRGGNGAGPCGVELGPALHVRRLARLRSVRLALPVIDDGAALSDLGIARTSTACQNTSAKIAVCLNWAHMDKRPPLRVSSSHAHEQHCP